MIRLRIPVLLAGLLFRSLLPAQPAGYYSSAEGLSGESLRQSLHLIIDDHAVSSYADLWDHFYRTDRKTDGSVWDMYSDNPSGAEPYTYTFVTDQCGNYSGEGDCYNREHSFPKSWFGGEVLPMYTDLFHLYPTDGYVNNRRGNLPYGETGSAAWVSMNGSRVGPCSVEGYGGNVFEPIDDYKGDLARTCLYMAVRYYAEDGSWPGSDMTAGAEPLPWAIDMLLNWHNADQVSGKEIARNDSVYRIQGNRNPFIDHPEYAAAIWDVQNSSWSAEPGDAKLVVYPNPASGTLRILVPGKPESAYTLKIISIQGQTCLNRKMEPGEPARADVTSLPPGVYLLVVETPVRTWRQKVVIE